MLNESQYSLDLQSIATFEMVFLTSFSWRSACYYRFLVAVTIRILITQLNRVFRLGR